MRKNPKNPKLYLKLDSGVRAYVRDTERHAYAELTLRIDERRCRDYYGRSI